MRSIQKSLIASQLNRRSRGLSTKDMFPEFRHFLKFATRFAFVEVMTLQLIRTPNLLHVLCCAILLPLGLGTSWGQPHYRRLHSFGNLSRLGHEPHATMIQASNGNLYGTTYYSGIDPL